MADTILLRAGNKAGMPKLNDREIAYVRDEKTLYVGTPGGNARIGAEKVESLPVLEDTADLAAVISAYNGLIAALKKSGVMSE